MTADCRVLLTSGRLLVESPYRELRVVSALRARGVDVAFALPSRRLNAFGYPDAWREDPTFAAAGALWLDDEQDFARAVRGCDFALFGSWKTYDRLAELASAAGATTVTLNGTSGLDHWVHGCDWSCVKGPFLARKLVEQEREWQRPCDPQRIVVTGSPVHEVEPGGDDREALCARYGLDPRRPLVAHFPKGVAAVRQKVAGWFPDRSDAERLAFAERLEARDLAICRAAAAAGLSVIVKQHPSAYAGYRTELGDEVAYWQRELPDVPLLRTEDTYALYRHVDVGLGTITHTALDFAWFRKPFVYVDSDAFELPPTVPHVHHLCEIPLGPSSHWDAGPLSDVNPWLPSWLGAHARVEELGDAVHACMETPLPEAHVQRYLDEFWGGRGTASERIAEFALSLLESRAKSRDA